MASAHTSNGEALSPELEDLKEKLLDRMVRNGDWNKLTNRLSNKLNESGWNDDVKDHAKELARHQETLNFGALQKQVNGYAQNKVPAHIKDEILADVRRMVEKEVEEA